jgi:glutamate racemase
MSENIESSLNKLMKKHGTFTYNPKSSNHMLERIDSGVIGCSHFAVVKEKIGIS